MRQYVWNVIVSATKKSWGKLGMAVNLALSAIAILAFLIVRKPTVNDLIGGELVLAIWLMVAAYVVTLIPFIAWELQAVFPNLKVEKRNTMRGAKMVIWNNNVFDLTELSVEILQKTWVTRESKVRIPIDPNNRALDTGGDAIITYGGGSKTVRVASGEGKNANFHTKILDPDIGYEHYDGADHSKYDIVIQIKGKIDGHPISPKIIKGRLSYIRANQEFPLHVGHERQVIRNTLSKMEWENLA